MGVVEVICCLTGLCLLFLVFSKLFIDEFEFLPCHGMKVVRGFHGHHMPKPKDVTQLKLSGVPPEIFVGQYKHLFF